ncbi:MULTISPECIES: cupin domain-containing protein [unclassified Cupriavidus]|uniref:cupin domain-containing protein n=1 Tax=unclassified Cupriavidus TaxID=2640874 RepID=UPI001AE3F233|nr:MULTISPECIES: cupin domain-containing protein [unclassified Cupriavidus]MBP0632263.1 cupin domain-containing protein [Cupriavidus sp. AcVe19-1a]MBP0636844.1 cupin domain-containing protein [Cupriavidus sp. AcVe19-6a]
MALEHGSLLADVPVNQAEEVFQPLLARPGLKIERIVSNGQASPAGFWYDSAEAEWVLLVSGSAALEVEGESALRVMQPGEWLHLPAHCRHRVAWTDAAQPTVWLAVHYDAGDKAPAPQPLA